ncbi:hypothetical protein MHYP_G00105290 [Metynnis hypsauchen]
MTLREFLALLLPLLFGSTSVSQVLFPTDCSDVYANGQTLSGVYTIYPAGGAPVEVQCDMGCDGQTQDANWTVIQRRMDGSVNFYRPWDQYKNGFGNKYGEYWLGLENLYQLTSKRKYELRVDLQDFEEVMTYAQYSFSVASEVNGYQLTVGGFIDGGAGDSLGFHNGQKFSTFDKDQDAWGGGTCAKTYIGAFWYSACHQANPNGIYLWGKDGTLFALGNVWYTWKGYDYGLKSISMKIRPVI